MSSQPDMSSINANVNIIFVMSFSGNIRLILHVYFKMLTFLIVNLTPHHLLERPAHRFLPRLEPQVLHSLPPRIRLFLRSWTVFRADEPDRGDIDPALDGNASLYGLHDAWWQ